MNVAQLHTATPDIYFVNIMQKPCKIVANTLTIFCAVLLKLFFGLTVFDVMDAMTG